MKAALQFDAIARFDFSQWPLFSKVYNGRPCRECWFLFSSLRAPIFPVHPPPNTVDTVYIVPTLLFFVLSMGAWIPWSLCCFGHRRGLGIVRAVSAFSLHSNMGCELREGEAPPVIHATHGMTPTTLRPLDLQQYAFNGWQWTGGVSLSLLHTCMDNRSTWIS